MPAIAPTVCAAATLLVDRDRKQLRPAILAVGRRAARALALALGLAIVVSPAAAQPALVTLPMDDPAHTQLLGLERMGCAAARVSPFRPYFVGRVRAALPAMRAEPACRGRLLDALVARFLPDSAAPADTATTLRDTLANVAPDLAQAVIATQRQAPEVASRTRAYAGAMATLQLTGLGEGEFRPLWDGVKPIEDGTPPAVGILRARGTVEGNERLVAVVEAYGQTNRRNDPTARARLLRRTTGFVDFADSYLTGQVGPLALSLGRAPEAWLGEGRESVILSSHGPPLDRLMASASWRRVEARAIVASLDDMTLTVEQDSLVEGTPPTRVTRWLVGHALAWRPSRALELTIGETAVLTRSNGLLELSYLNPMMIYLVTQNDSGRLDRERDNLAIFGAARWRTGPVTLTGELFVDEYQLDAGDRKAQPNQLAWRVAAQSGLPRLILPASVGLEYRRADNYAYMRGVYSEVHQHYDRPLGTELGPGADLLQGTAELFLSPRARLAGRVGVWRQGALRIDQRPGQRATGNADAPFPRTFPDQPGVQRTLLAGFDAELLQVTLPITFRLELARIENAANQPTPAALYVRAHLAGSYAFRYP